MSLFQTQKSSSTTLYDTAAQQVVTLIGSGTICEGKLHAEGSTRIDGEIKGEGIPKRTTSFWPGKSMETLIHQKERQKSATPER